MATTLVEPVKARVLRHKWAKELCTIIDLAKELLTHTDTTSLDSLQQIIGSGNIAAENLVGVNLQYVQNLAVPDPEDKHLVAIYDQLVLKHDNVESAWLKIRSQLSQKLTSLTTVNPFNAQSPQVQTARPPPIKQPDRPTIDLDCSETKWLFFLDEWRVYKKKVTLNPGDLTDELRYCCTVELRQALFNMVGPDTLSTLTEISFLDEIKRVAVRGKNISVHRNEFHGMRQSPGQHLQDFVSSLRAKSEHCKFSVTCSNQTCNTEVSYAEAMIADQMVPGVYDKEIQADVLAKAAMLDTFQKKFDHMHCLELGKEAKSELGFPDQSQAAGLRSPYQQAKRENTIQQAKKDNPSTGPAASKQASKKRCHGCGGPLHGKNTREHVANKKNQVSGPQQQMRTLRTTGTLRLCMHE